MHTLPLVEACCPLQFIFQGFTGERPDLVYVSFVASLFSFSLSFQLDAFDLGQLLLLLLP